MWEEELLSALDTLKDREREKEISIAASSMASPPPCTGEASHALAPSQFGLNLDPLKFVLKKTPKNDKEKTKKTVDPRSVDESCVLHQRGSILMIHHKYRII
ncbi:uncharacterized protein LOC131041378 [Cryptomeria japonica]|uniref:uncharacterized protein LOC131041378 n=1 Tax=Cryptomeria japonica TaxID=3369 RepID=UPI0025AB956B|nr:uncharacterized protein LOC131041378 [Cryptomeria japonica]